MNRSGNASRLNPSRWVEEHGDAMFRFALVRVGRLEVAEDLVQDALVAALRNHHKFQGKSEEGTWLISILKHKVVDYLRHRNREQPLSTNEDGDNWLDELFNARERWKVPPGRWGTNPEQAFEHTEFWNVFENCLDKLPQRLALAFSLRELEENSTDNICKELDITPTNLWVILHRARMRLAKCLNKNWFGSECR